jgi:signal peptidase
MASEAPGLTPRASAHESRRAGRLGAHAVRWVSLAAVWALIGLLLGLAAAITLPAAFGYKSLTILSGSMEPTLRTGGVAVDEMITPEQARIGDIVTFTDPDDGGRLLTHRLKSIRIEGGIAHMVTLGDANDAPERWNVSLDTEIGRVVYHIPVLGYIRAWISGRIARLAMLIAIGCLALWMLIDIWRDRTEIETRSS